MNNLIIDKLNAKLDITPFELKQIFKSFKNNSGNKSEIKSFFDALNKKGPTTAEFSGIVLCLAEGVDINSPFKIGKSAIENIVLDENFKFFDISFVVDIISSCCGLSVFRCKFDDELKKLRSFDSLNHFGLNEINLTSEINKNFKKTNFFYVKIPSCSRGYDNVYETAKKHKRNSIIPNALKLINPFGVTNQTIGVCSKEDAQRYAECALLLGNKNTVSFCHDDSMPLVSPEGDTYICEAWRNKIFSYTLSSDVLGIKQSPLSDIMCENINESCEIILDVLINRKLLKKIPLY